MTLGRTMWDSVARAFSHRWASSAVTIAVAGLVFVKAAVAFASDRAYVSPIVVGTALLVLAYLVSPWFFPRSGTDAQARRLAEERGAPVIYWRTGCSYCLRMRITLGLAGNRAVWMEVSKDPAASARVRDATGGDETVPTVFVGATARVNPAPSWVRAQLPTT